MANMLSSVFAKNRTEEFPDDVYSKYVLPINNHEIDISDASKACVIVGGRGSGKTMYLKYYCFPTILSSNRSDIDLKNLKNLGLYWRPDTSFTQHISQNWLGQYWSSAFNSYMTLSILIEYNKLLQTLINHNQLSENSKISIKNIEIPESITNQLSVKSDKIYLFEAKKILQNSLFTLCNWINSPFTETPPFSLNTKGTLSLIANELNTAVSELENITYHIFIDEFENLTESQQIIINTLMKHGEKQLIFSIAHKKNAIISHDTLGNEKIVERNDYRTIDLEKHYNNNFDVFAGEVLALRLEEFFDQKQLNLFVRKEENLEYRQTHDYLKEIRNLAERFLPSLTYSEMAQNIFSDNSLYDKLLAIIADGLVLHKKSKVLNAEQFIDIKFPEASLVNAAILNRNNTLPHVLLEQFEEYKGGTSNKYQQWIHNYLVGVILLIYKKSPSKDCPFYSGYKQYVLLSRGNIRHFLELCHQSVLLNEQFNAKTSSRRLDKIPVNIQSRATKKTSGLELEKISDLGSHGSHLKKIATRLGRIYSYSQTRKSQSEVEINHFSLDLSDETELNEDTRTLLNEAIIWSVLIEEHSTKQKNSESLEVKDYVLHPVLSAHFGISYRKKKKLKLNKESLTIIFTADDNKFNRLLKSFITKWDLDEEPLENTNDVVKQLGLL